MVETQVKTKVIRLDKKLRGNNKNIDLIKIDTEGYKFQVLKGVGKNLDISRYLIVNFIQKNIFKLLSRKDTQIFNQKRI